jgi:Holliday junction resolvase RusA-like endonuclease
VDELMNATLTLPGRPITKKNSQEIHWHGSRPSIAQGKRYRQYEKECLTWLMGYLGPRFQAGVKLNLAARYYLPDRRGWPDLVGLLQATQDILQKAGVIHDDKEIVALDGCFIAGVDKANPRVEIEIREVEA